MSLQQISMPVRITKCPTCKKFMIDCKHIVPVSVPRPLYHLKIKTFEDGTLRYPAMWEEIRNWELNRTHKQCDYCGCFGKIIHEVWDYDDANGIQYLVAFRTVCFECNYSLHPYYAKHVGKIKEAIYELQMVNKMGTKEAVDMIYACMRLAKKRNNISWTQDLTWIPIYIGDRIAEDMKNRVIVRVEPEIKSKKRLRKKRS